MIEVVKRGSIRGDATHTITSFYDFGDMEPGDLMVIGINGHVTSVEDERFTWLSANQELSLGPAPRRQWSLGYWWSPDDVPVDTTPLSCYLVDFHPLTYIGIAYTIFRNVTTIGEVTGEGMVFDPGSTVPYQDVDVPDTPSRAAISVWFEESFGTVPGKTFSAPESGWEPSPQGSGRASCSIFLWQSASGEPEPIPTYGFRTIGSGGARMRGHVIAVDYEPVEPEPDPDFVVRQWPRDDARGCSSAPRLWPTGKSHRMAGGYPGGAGA